ncbi:MAG: hypothetical protein OJF59_000281 [Cytophagales bacterium]|nr:MAG: hypothetical protein OJF59_000281 [Cytophagales bacterium]
MTHKLYNLTADEIKIIEYTQADTNAKASLPHGCISNHHVYG